MNFTNIINLLGTKNMGSEVYSLYLNEVRKNLASPGKLLLRRLKRLLWCSPRQGLRPLPSGCALHLHASGLAETP